MKNKLYCFILLALFAILHQAAAQGTTAFTYQGQLHDNGTNANGAYTMTFKLYDAVTSGNQIGSTITTSATLANGLFSVNLDFGNAFNGSARWLDITVAGDTLTPRVQVLPTPYAQFAALAATVTNGAIINSKLAANAVYGGNIANGQVVRSINGFTDTVILNFVNNLNGLAGAVQLAAGTNVTIITNGNVLQISSLGGAAVPNGIQTFTGGGTFTVPAGITRIQVEAWGGGGGGGGGFTGTNGDTFGGGGGGSGGYGIQFYGVTSGGNYSVVVGGGGSGGNGGNNFFPTSAGSAGGPSSFGGTLVVNGGGGGSGATSSANGTGGAKPSSTSGSAFPSGVGGGGNGGINFSGISIGGQGGSSFRGGSGAMGGPAAGSPYGHGGNNAEGADGNLGAGGGGGGGSNGGGGMGGGGGGGAVIITY